MGRGASNMLWGAILCAVGLGVTAATYSYAQPGGRFVMAWGAIAIGAIQFLVGAVQSIADRGRG